MNELTDRMNLIKSTLAAAYPTRTVTRSMKDFADRKKEELRAGVYTVISMNEGSYQNLPDRAAMDGKHRILLVGQIEVDEKTSPDPESIEEAEFAMVEEIKAFVRALPVGLCGLEMRGFSQSGQLEYPYGWISVNLEVIP